MSAQPVTMPDLNRRVPPFGGFNLTFVRLEVRRMLRNKRTMVFTLIMPVAFYFLFGYSQRGNTVGSANAATYIMVNLGTYGAMVATMAGAAMVAVERAQGWSRQLRLTPLRPTAYMVTKVLTAMTLGAMAVAVEFIVGAATGVKLGIDKWILCALAAWLCAFVFAAMGLFVGYLLPSENAMQVMGPILALLALLGGLFVPLSVWGHTFREIARWTPAYGVGEIARSPLRAEHFDWASVPNIIIWGLIFGIGSAILFRRDTRRV